MFSLGRPNARRGEARSAPTNQLACVRPSGTPGRGPQPVPSPHQGCLPPVTLLTPGPHAPAAQNLRRLATLGELQTLQRLQALTHAHAATGAHAEELEQVADELAAAATRLRTLAEACAVEESAYALMDGRIDPGC